MKNLTIKEIRKVLVDELKDYVGEPVLLDIDSKILSKILFDTYTDDDIEYKKFSKEISSVIKKIDFSNVSFDNFYASKATFIGFKGVKINPQTVAYKDLSYSTFHDVTFIGTFDGVNIVYTNFYGSKGAVINPQTVASKKLYSCNFSSVTFIGPFDDCNICYSNFEGSNGALIDPQTVWTKTLNWVNLKDAIVIDDFDGVETSCMKIDEELLVDRYNMDNEESKKYCIGKIKESVRRK